MNGNGAMQKAIEWSLLKSFLAVVETRSLTAAASRLAMTQPTLGRHVSELEAAFGVSLFKRSTRGLEPTDAALALVADAQAMAAAADALTLKAQGRSKRMSGTVRIASSVMVANLVLPSILTELRQVEPLIQIEIVASDAAQNLLQRDADIAIRMFDPTQTGLIARKVGDASIGIYGAKRYLESRGRPTTIAELAGHDLIGFDRSDAIDKLLASHGLYIKRENFAIRCDDPLACWHYLLSGAGIGFAQTIFADQRPELEMIDVGLSIPLLPVWLVMPEGVRDNARIRRVADFVFERLPYLTNRILEGDPKLI